MNLGCCCHGNEFIGTVLLRRKVKRVEGKRRRRERKRLWKERGVSSLHSPQNPLTSLFYTLLSQQHVGAAQLHIRLLLFSLYEGKESLCRPQFSTFETSKTGKCQRHLCVIPLLYEFCFLSWLWVPKTWCYLDRCRKVKCGVIGIDEWQGGESSLIADEREERTLLRLIPS